MNDNGWTPDRGRQLAAILQGRYQMLTCVDLDNGMCERRDLSCPGGPVRSMTGPYGRYIDGALNGFVHPEDAEEFRSTLSLEHLRERAAGVVGQAEECCQYRLRGGTEERWIRIQVLYARVEGQVMVNLLGRDVTEEMRREGLRLQAMEDRGDMIAALSRLFFSTYYIDLARDTFRAVTQQRRVGDVLGDEINCTAALQLYASHFVHPDDRANYLAVMNIRNMRENLRWWKPSVTVAYRRLPDGGEGPCMPVRATAVLARSGPDDLPETVVYVAQDISGS